MQLERTAVIGSVIACTLLAGCGAGTPPTTPAPAKDSEVRLYIDAQLVPYLAKIVKELCLIKYDAAPTVGDDDLCPGDPEGYKPPPTNGKP